MVKHDLAAQTIYCIIDKKAIPEERAVRKSNTCSPECAKQLRGIRRAQVDQRKCRLCCKPSSPDERKLFQQWRRSQPDYQRKKAGRPVTKKEETA